MAIHALIRTGDLTDVGTRNDFDGGPIPDLLHKNPSLSWVPVVNAADPNFDAAIERLVRADDVIALTELTQGREIEALTAEEIARRAEQAAHSSDGQNTDNWQTVFRAGNGTNRQVQDAIAWLLREVTGTRP